MVMLVTQTLNTNYLEAITTKTSSESKVQASELEEILWFCLPRYTLNCIQTDLFSLAGKEATIKGLDIQQATYSQTADGGAIDVFVYSEDEQNIEVSGDGIANTTLAGGNGQYFTHVPYTGSEPPAEVTLTNTTDNPKTIKTI